VELSQGILGLRAEQQLPRLLPLRILAVLLLLLWRFYLRMISTHPYRP
jgi:hypothetical protein